MAIAGFETREHDPRTRGEFVGAALRGRIGVMWDGYERLFATCGLPGDGVRAAGERALEQTAAWAPALAAEIGGLAGAAGLAPWQAGALNARTEILAGAGVRAECSTFAVAPREPGVPPRTIQTWDWYEHLRGNTLTLVLEPRPGHVVRVFTELGIVGKIGVNSAGLGLHLNILRHADDGGPAGVPVHVVARRILDEAASVEEAAELARSARVSASTSLTVVAWDGERASARGLELSPAGLAALEPDGDGVLLHSNHFLDPRLAGGERNRAVDPTTAPRLALLAARAGELRAAPDAIARAAALLDHATELCCHAADGDQLTERWETLATISLDVAAGTLEVHEGGPCAVEPAGWRVV